MQEESCWAAGNTLGLVVGMRPAHASEGPAAKKYEREARKGALYEERKNHWGLH